MTNTSTEHILTKLKGPPFPFAWSKWIACNWIQISITFVIRIFLSREKHFSSNGFVMDSIKTVWCVIQMYPVSPYVNYIMTLSNRNLFQVTRPLWGESTGHRLISFTKASDVELRCFLLSVPEQTPEQTIETPMIWDTGLIMTSLQWYKVQRLYPFQKSDRLQ